MRITELIKHLEALKEKVGDVECWYENYHIGSIDRVGIPEYNEIKCNFTNYRGGFIPECHPFYKGVFIGGD